MITGKRQVRQPKWLSDYVFPSPEHAKTKAIKRKQPAREQSETTATTLQTLREQMFEQFMHRIYTKSAGQVDLKEQQQKPAPEASVEAKALAQLGLAALFNLDLDEKEESNRPKRQRRLPVRFEGTVFFVISQKSNRIRRNNRI